MKQSIEGILELSANLRKRITRNRYYICYRKTKNDIN